MTARTKTSFNLYSVLLFLFPLGMIVVMVFQRLSDQYQAQSPRKVDRDQRTTKLLYAIYISGLCCGVIGFSLHFASNELWCEKMGLIPCFALLGLSKAFLYLFFLRRAKLAQGIVVSKGLKLFFNYIAPAYLFVYWMIYCILSAFVFSGNYSHDAISNCNLLGDYASAFSIFAGFVELFNSISCVSIFSYPLIRAMHQVKTLAGVSELSANSDHQLRTEFISVMKWNVTLSAIASLSSVTNLFMLLVAGHFIWLFCLGDPFINGVCVFLMIAPNRMYVARLFGCVSAKSGDQLKRIDSAETRTRTRSTTSDDEKETDIKSKDSGTDIDIQIDGNPPTAVDVTK